MFIISPKYRKSLVEVNTIEKEINGVKYQVKKTTVWRTGEFNIWLDDDEYKKLMKMNNETIYLTDYETEFLSSYDACSVYYEVYRGDDLIEDGDIYFDIMDIIDEDYYLLEDENGWFMTELIYVINGGFEISN